MIRYRLLLTGLLGSLALALLAQQDDVNPFYGNGYIGYTTKRPSLPQDYEPIADWQGIEAQLGSMVFGVHRGRHRLQDADSTVASIDGSLFQIGYRIGYPLDLGYNSMLSAAIKPYLQVSGSYASISDRPLNDVIGSAGLVFSPGVEARFSQFYLVAQYDAGLYMNTNFFGGNRQYNVARGYIGGVTLTLGIDNAFDLLAPSAYTSSGYDVAISESKREETRLNERNGRLERWVITTTTTNYSPGTRMLYLMRPFWGVGPTYSFAPRRGRRAATDMIGINAGTRFWYLSLDGFYETGHIGTEGQVGRNPILINYPELRDYDFSSRVPATQYGGKVGLNVTKVFSFLNFVQSSRSKRYTRWRVPFLRLEGYYTYGVATFDGEPEYTYTDARARLQDYQSRNDILPDATNNPDFLPESSTFSGYGVSIEAGSAFGRYTWYEYHDASLADHGQWTVGANIPLGRFFNYLRFKRAVRR